jgi:hypothetical protein
VDPFVAQLQAYEASTLTLREYAPLLFGAM